MSTRRTLVQAFIEVVRKHPAAEALLYHNSVTKTFVVETYAQLYEKVLKLASFLEKVGLVKEEKVAILSDNNARWPVVDFAIQGLGGVNVAKGSDSKVEETSFILNFCEVEKVFLENKNLVTYFIANRDQYKTVKQVFVMFDKDADLVGLRALGLEVYSLPEILQEDLLSDQITHLEEVFAQGEGDDLASIIFTSGTTGEPKGVVLSHYNTLWQIENSGDHSRATVGVRMLCVLPIWHSFQRLVNYLALCSGATSVYSKPIPQVMLRDIAEANPEYLICVPRLLTAIQEGVYNNLKKAPWISRAIFKTFFLLSWWNVFFGRRILNRVPEFTRSTPVTLRFISLLGYVLTLPFLLIGRGFIFRPVYKRMGRNFKYFVSGGGKFPKMTERFFSVLGMQVQDSYGLTETAPGVAMRKTKGSLPGTVGSPFATTEVEFRDEEGHTVPQGEKGILFVKGPQIMKGGYYKRPDLTAQVITPDGWFNTGDLGRQSRQGDIEILGRVKDTIVLLSGKNIEPLPLEDAMRESEYIDQAIVLGQDQKYLGALIVINLEAIEKVVQSSKSNTLRSRAKAVLTSAQVEGHLDTIRSRAQELINLPEQNLAALKNIPKEKWFETQEVKDLIQSEIRNFVNVKNGFKDYELITSFKILSGTFEVGREISPKLEVKRHVVNEMYKKEIASLFS